MAGAGNSTGALTTAPHEDRMASHWLGLSAGQSGARLSSQQPQPRHRPDLPLQETQPQR